MLNKLQEIKENLNGFELYVIEDILDNDNPADYLKDILNSGCVSGIVSALIYYTDTTKVYNDYEFEILEILENVEYFIKENHESIIDYLKNGQEQIKNHMVWTAFESVCYDIMRKIDEDY